MSAGASAQHEAQRSLLEAAALEREAAACRQRARAFKIAAESEASVAGTLHALEQFGWVVLADRRWGRRSNIDFLLIGPGGVLVVDVKQWASLEISGGTIFRGQEPCDDELDKQHTLSDQVADVLTEHEIAPGCVRSVLLFRGKDVQENVQGVHVVGEERFPAWLLRLPELFDPVTVEVVTETLAESYPAFDADPVRTVTTPRRRAVVPRRKTRAQSTETPQDVPAEEATTQEPTEGQAALFDEDELTDALLAAALAAPIEEWMTFLHPHQLKFVAAHHRGPARVRGPAGTGKTVVGLHRATHLARSSQDPIHFVTFVRTLPAVLRTLATRLDPDSASRIEFTGLHQLARSVIEEAGASAPLDLRKVNSAFARAWLAVGRGSALERLDERPTYWQEEIDYVIKGRGITDFERYADLARTGRHTRMARSHREVMWDLYVAYSQHLDEAGTRDFNDWLILALDLVRSERVQIPCGGVIVDEVQDLTMVGLQFLHALAGDGPDRFLLIGDGQQSIYPGGFTLTEAGVDVRGRATVLEVNYRNTVEILHAAEKVIGRDTFDDLEGASEAGRRRVEVRRTGQPPVVETFESTAAAETGTVAHLRKLVEQGVRPGDVALLLLRSRDVDRYTALLRRSGLEVLGLLDYAGETGDRVKVGTVKRAKGLEFAHVLLPELVEEPPQWAGESDESYEERLARHRREVFVAMTRARDGLWIGDASTLR